MTPHANAAQGILKNDIVVEAMQRTADNDQALYGELQNRAYEAAQVALRLADGADRRLSDKALIDIACSAVTEADPAKSALACMHSLNGWLGGPANVPSDLRLAWDPSKRGKGKTKAKAEPADPETAAVPEITAGRGAELVEAQGTAALMDQAVLDMAPVAEALGRVKAAEFFRRVGDIVIAQTFSDLRNSKKYKDYPIRDDDGNIRRVEDFKEFCQVAFGKSYTRCFELAQNLHTLGSDLYEAAERVGFKARDYAALKALPAAEQEVVKQALASESKEQVLDILQDMAARHASERAAAKKETDDLKADKDALDKLLQDKTAKADDLAVKLEKLRALPENKRAKLRLEQEEQAAAKLSEAVMGAIGAVNEFCRQLADIKGAEVSIYTQQHADGTASWFCQQIQLALQENGIQADMAEIVLPAWMRDEAKSSPVAEVQA